MERKRPSPHVSGKRWRDLRWTLHTAENVTLSGLYVYPIKSCAGISLQSAELCATGLRHDRRWMLVDETGEFMSQRDHPRMALISTHLSAEYLTVAAPGMPDLEIPIQQDDEDLIDVRVFGDTNRGALVGGEADRWFGEVLEFPCRLVHKPDDDLRLVDSSFAESWDQSTREQAPAVTYARDLSNVRAWVRLRTQPHPRRTRDRPCR